MGALGSFSPQLRGLWVDPRSTIHHPPSTNHAFCAAARRNGRAALIRGSKASRTASANKFAESTIKSMKQNADASDHHTIGSRAISRRAPLIIVPKLIIVG